MLQCVHNWLLGDIKQSGKNLKNIFMADCLAKNLVAAVEGRILKNFQLIHTMNRSELVGTFVTHANRKGLADFSCSLLYVYYFLNCFCTKASYPTEVHSQRKSTISFSEKMNNLDFDYKLMKTCLVLITPCF